MKIYIFFKKFYESALRLFGYVKFLVQSRCYFSFLIWSNRYVRNTSAKIVDLVKSLKAPINSTKKPNQNQTQQQNIYQRWILILMVKKNYPSRLILVATDEFTSP